MVSVQREVAGTLGMDTGREQEKTSFAAIHSLGPSDYKTAGLAQQTLDEHHACRPGGRRRRYVGSRGLLTSSRQPGGAP